MAAIYLNLAAYKFMDWGALEARRDTIEASGVKHGLRGTVLLAPEGINLFVSAPPQAALAWLAELQADPLLTELAELDVKRSESDRCEFGRWRVRIKKEIITFRQPQVRPQERRATSVDAPTLSRWLDRGVDDEGLPIKLVDTRNAFEVQTGTFENAVDLRIGAFTEFPTAVAAQADQLAGARVVTFCTGGIRCEKAALFMEQQGIQNVVQLDGGVLRYFEQVGKAHWQGELFVFDERVALDETLRPASRNSTQSSSPS